MNSRFTRGGRWLRVSAGALFSFAMALLGTAAGADPSGSPEPGAEERFEAALASEAEAVPSSAPASSGTLLVPPALEAGKGELRPMMIEAVAVLHDSMDTEVKGTVTFEHVGDAIAVRARLGGLSPGAMYRMQIHEYGDCSALRASSAGEALVDGSRLAVFRAGEDGWVDLAFSHRGHALDRSEASVLGRSLVVHGITDREGCGTIGLARRQPAAEAEPVPAKIDSE